MHEQLVREHTALLVVLDQIDDDPRRADYPDTAAAAADSTVELRGVVIPPTELFWHFSKPPATIDGPELGRTSWEIERFCALGLAADPGVLTVLAAPRVVAKTSFGAELRELTTAFLSQRAADSYRRATATEFARASAAMASSGTPRWPQLAEVVRTLIVCERLLRTGELDPDIDKHRDQLLAVQAGELPWRDTQDWVQSLRDRSAEAVLRSPLPVTPNTEAVQRWLVSVRRRNLTP
ncbi:MAG TPA: nucleotidyltransferase domain-containing protein [Pseudonocardiaceae bacterium]